MMANDEQVPFLAPLGIPERAAAMAPTVQSFPSAFNQQGQKYWPLAVEAANMAKGISIPERWQLALNFHVDKCVESGVFPYAQADRQARNDQIYSHLSKARAEVVKFMNRSGVRDMLKFERGVQEARMLDSGGFLIRVDAKVRLLDFTFSKWLTQKPNPGFMNINFRFLKPLPFRGAEMFAYNEGADMTQRWHFGYEIICPIYPGVPGSQLAGKQEMERFILDVLWNPVMRSQRPDHMLHRLF